MRVLYVLALVFGLGALGLAKMASDQWADVSSTRVVNDSLRDQIVQLDASVRAARQRDPWPLQYADLAMSQFFTRTVEAGEVLGAGVRIKPRNEMLGVKAVSFVEHVPGVKRSEVTLHAGLELEGAPAILAMLEEELADMQLIVRKVTARASTDALAVTMDIDVLGR